MNKFNCVDPMTVSAKKAFQEVSTDPAVGWSVMDVLLFAGNNPIGVGAYAASAVIASTCKALSLKTPKWLDKMPRLKRVVGDDRTPMRAGGIASLVMMTLAAIELSPLVALTSLSFAGGYFKTGQSLSEARRAAENPAAENGPMPSIGRLMYQRPDMYIAVGFVMAGLLAGGASLYALPAIAAGCAIGLRNIVKKKPEHAHHPKLVYGLASTFFSYVGFAAGLPVIGVAHAMGAAIFLKVESDITPGGFKQVIKDVFGPAKRLLSGRSHGKDKGKKQIRETAATAAVAPIRIESLTALTKQSVRAPFTAQAFKACPAKMPEEDTIVPKLPATSTAPAPSHRAP